MATDNTFSSHRTAESILIRESVLLVRQIGRAGVKEVALHLPDATPDQINHALTQAAFLGHLRRTDKPGIFEYVPQPTLVDDTASVVESALNSRKLIEIVWSSLYARNPSGRRTTQLAS
jgi:hypothetical protein